MKGVERESVEMTAESDFEFEYDCDLNYLDVGGLKDEVMIE